MPGSDIILPLRRLNSYPGAEGLDAILYLPGTESRARRVWLAAPSGSPTIAIGDLLLAPQRVSPGPPRWVDYSLTELPDSLKGPGRGHFTYLRVRGMSAAECRESHLIVSAQTDLSLDGCDLVEAQRRLWGIVRADAGTTTISPPRLEVGSPAHFVVRYIAGPRGLPAGARIRFAVPKAFRRPQTDDPSAPGFVRIASPDDAVSVAVIEDSIESHEAVDIICAVRECLAPGAAFELHYRTDRTYIFPGQFHEVDRRYWYSRLPPLAAAVALSEQAQFVAPEDRNSHSLEFVPGPPARLHLFLPGRRRASEHLTLRGVFTDRYRNVPRPGPIDFDFELWLIGGPQPLPLGAAAGRMTARHRFEIRLPSLQPGIYRAIARRSGNGENLAASNPLEVMSDGDGRPRIYWGEIHGHTEMSDGSGGYAELYRHAREEGCMDFAAAADHVCYFSDNEWELMQDITNAYDDPGRFVTLVGYEGGTAQNHRNVYTSRDRLELVRHWYGLGSPICKVWQRFRGDEQIVAGPHAPVCHGIKWECHEPSVERFVEVYSMWGQSDTLDGPLIPAWVRAAGGPYGQVTVNDMLRTGAKLGFTGGGDCHEGRAGFSPEDPEGQGTTCHGFAAIIMFRCGMTAALMPELDRQALIRALRQRQTYATTGARILLDFEVSGFPTGAIGESDRAQCWATIHAVQLLRTVEIIRDGEIVWSRQCDGLDADVAWEDPRPVVQEQYYYLHVIQADGEMAWSSPVWLQPVSIAHQGR